MKPYFETLLDNLVSPKPNCNLDNINFSFDNLKHYPTYLYKFRDCNKEYNFDMLEEDYLWADNPSNFLDPSDSIVNFKIKSEIPSIQKWLYSHLGELLFLLNRQNSDKKLHEYLEVQTAFLDSKGRFNPSKFEKTLDAETEKLPPEKRELTKAYFDYLESTEFEIAAQKRIVEIFQNLTNLLRNGNLVCCLTQRKENQKMWEEYSDKYTGFVIEYSLSKVKDFPESYKFISQLFPVSYRKSMPKVPLVPFLDSLINKEVYNIETDVSDATRKLVMQLLVKKEEYSGEEEWRILSPVQRIPFPFISAVYMGYKISDENTQRLIEICTKKNIPLYRQKFSPISFSMEFESVGLES